MKIFKSLSDNDLSDQLVKGRIGVIPTDTVMGLACVASLHSSVARLYELKSRERKPGTIIAANVDQLVDLGIKRRYLKPVEHFWPNPLSVVIPCGMELQYLHDGAGSLAVRVVNNELLVKLLIKTGPLMTSSANLPGQPESQNIEEAINYFGDKVDFYVVEHEDHKAQASTVIRVVDDAVEILRQGDVIISEEKGIIT